MSNPYLKHLKELRKELESMSKQELFELIGKTVELEIKQEQKNSRYAELERYIFLEKQKEKQSVLDKFNCDNETLDAIGKNLEKYNTNSTVDNKKRRDHLLCPRCPPNKGDNAKNRSKRGPKKPKYKDKR